MTMFSIKRCLSTLLILFSIGLGATTAKESHPFTYSFTAEEQIKDSDPIKIKNRYGDVKVEVWKKQSVKVAVNITGESYDEAILKDFYAQMKEDFIDLSKHVVVSPPISSYQNSSIVIMGMTKGKKRHFVEMKDGTKYNLSDIRVSYTVFLPDNHRLYTDIKYHNLDLKSYSGETVISHYNGTVNIEELRTRSTVSVKYGALKIGSGRDISVNLYDGSLVMKKAGKLNLSSKYSDIEIGELQSASITSFDDDIEIGTITTLTYNAKYTEFKAGDMEALTATIYEGDLHCGSVKKVNLNAKYAEISFNTVDEFLFGSAYDCEFSANELGTCTLGSSKYSEYDIDVLSGSFTSVNYTDDISIEWVRPSVAQMTINSKYGNFDLKMDKGFGHQMVANLKYGDFDYPIDYYKINSELVNGSSTVLSGNTTGGKTDGNLTITSYSTEFDIELK